MQTRRPLPWLLFKSFFYGHTEILAGPRTAKNLRYHLNYGKIKLEKIAKIE